MTNLDMKVVDYQEQEIVDKVKKYCQLWTLSCQWQVLEEKVLFQPVRHIQIKEVKQEYESIME